MLKHVSTGDGALLAAAAKMMQEYPQASST
jgi:hypothetical protein